MYCRASATDWIRSSCLMVVMAAAWDAGGETAAMRFSRRTTRLLCRKRAGAPKPLTGKRFRRRRGGGQNAAGNAELAAPHPKEAPMRKEALLCTIAVALLACGTAQAASDGQFYLGASAGQSSYRALDSKL